MPKTLPLVLALLTLFSAPLRAQCDQRPVFSGAYRTSAVDLAIDGSDLWVATQYGVALYDRTSMPPRQIARLALPGPTSNVRASGGIAWVGSGSDVYTVRHDGAAIRLVSTTPIGGTVRDLLFFPPSLFVAASNGVTQLDLFQPERPVVANRLTTTTGSASSLARYDTTLYAADGDFSVEVYSIAVVSLPQKIGTFNALPQTTSVRIAGTRLFASDGQQTQMFAAGGASPARVGSFSFGSIALHPVDTNVAWIAGSDRTLRIIDFTEPAAVAVLFQTTFAPSGSVNRIGAITGANGNVYVAAGDNGLVSFDATRFSAPFPLHAFALADVTGAGVVTNGIVTASAGGGLGLYTSNGSTLVRTNSWAPESIWSIRDTSGSRVLASAGSQLKFFDTTSNPVGVVAAGTFRSPVRSAVITTSGALVVLEDRSLWRADLTQPSFTPQQVSISGTPSFIARAGAAIVLADLTTEGSTLLRYWSDGDVTKTPSGSATVEGAATSGVTLSAGVAAVATFRGISLVDFNPLSTRVSLIPNVPPGVGLKINGDDLLFLSGTRLYIYSVSTKALVDTVELGNDAVGFARGDTGTALNWIVTGGGLVSYIRNASTLPKSFSSPNANRFYKTLSVDDDLLILADGPAVDRFLVTSGSGLVSYVGSLTLDPATIDVVVSAGRLFALTNDGRVIEYLANGSEVARVQVSEGSDALPLKIRAVGGAIHASILRGCLAGTCEKKTFVLDPRNGLQVASSYAGGIIDAAVSGSTAFILVDLPAELRRLDITDPFHPIVSASVSTTGNPTSVAYSAALSSVLVLGDKLSFYAPATLTKTGEALSPFVADPSGRVAYVDQALRLSGDCVTVAGRAFQPQRLRLTGAAAVTDAGSLALPAAGKRIAVTADAAYILTDYSLEIFSSRPAPKRKRAPLH